MYLDGISTASAKTANKALRAYNMRIVRNFSPVNSAYKFKLGNDRRISIVLDKNELVQKEERFVKGKWVQSVEMRLKGAADRLEDALIETVKRLIR